MKRISISRDSADARFAPIGGYKINARYRDDHSQDIILMSGWNRELVESLRKPAEQGDLEAQFNLGLLYANGIDVPKDLAQAAEWYRRAAEQGDARAQNAMIPSAQARRKPSQPG
jgi:TPR repeat protein